MPTERIKAFLCTYEAYFLKIGPAKKKLPRIFGLLFGLINCSLSNPRKTITLNYPFVMIVIYGLATPCNK